MAEITFYSQSGNPASAACDGQILYENGATYATAHDAATGTNIDESGVNTIGCTNYKLNDTSWYVYRGLINFDTSALTAGATVTGAILYLYGQDHANPDGDDISLVANTIISDTTYAVADFDLFGTTKLATDISADTTDGAYNAFTLNVAGLAAINKTGVSKFGIRFAKDVSNTAPSGGNYVHFRSADYDSGSVAPKLVVTYTGGTTTSTSTTSTSSSTSTTSTSTTSTSSSTTSTSISTTSTSISTTSTSISTTSSTSLSTSSSTTSTSSSTSSSSSSSTTQTVPYLKFSVSKEVEVLKLDVGLVK